MMIAVVVALALSGCASYRSAWERDGACAVVCDYRQGYMSTAYALNSVQCRCYTPQLAAFNEGRMLPVDQPGAVVLCSPDCSAEAARLTSRQPWRAHPTHE